MKDREIEDKTWELWVHLKPFMTEDNQVSYEEMLGKVKNEEPKGYYIDQMIL